MQIYNKTKHIYLAYSLSVVMSYEMDAVELAQFLTIKDIVTEAGSLLLSSEKQTRAKLISAISVSAELQAVVRHAYQRKKEHQEEEKDRQLKRTRFCDYSIPKDEDGDFLRNPSEDIKQQALARFIDHTGNIATKMAICLACARELSVHDVQKVYVDEIPNRYLLTPIVRHQAQVLVDGLLLHTTSISEDQGRFQGPICCECLEDLEVGNLPVHSLVNGLWIGAVPDVLSVLNLPERLLVALYFPAVYVLKLYPQQKGAKQWDSASLNSGVRGNVSTYQLNTPDIARMVEGNILPHRPALLAATIAITIIGPSKLPVKSLPSLLTVSRHRVKAALIFLKLQNHLYHDIDISDDNLSLLPENGVPEDLLSVVKYSDEQHLLEKERAGYVVADEDDDGMSISVRSFQSAHTFRLASYI